MYTPKGPMRFLTTFVIALAAALALARGTAMGDPGDYIRTFQKPTRVAYDSFGRSVAAVGDNVLVGATCDDTGATDAGAAYLFNGSTGALLRTFLNPTPEDEDYFGGSVAAVGGNVLVGAGSADVGEEENAGAAYLFNGSTGALLRTFYHPTPEDDDYFGGSVAAVGNNVLVGASGDDTGATNAGAAYLFDGETGGWLATFENPTPGSNDSFGCSVAGVGDNVLVGAPGDSTGAGHAGAAYLFDGSTGALLQTFLNPTPAYEDYFGDAVAGFGSDALVGAPYEDYGWYDDKGAAYLFDASTGDQIRRFPNPDSFGEYDHFGCSVAAVGYNVLVGAYGDDTGATNAGVAFLFDASGQILKGLLNPTPEDSDRFGWSVAAVGDNVLVAAPWDNTGATSAGAAYLFRGVVPGNANLDGIVDISDFFILQEHFDETGESPLPWAHANFNADCIIDITDFFILKDHFDQENPEPATLSLLVIGALALLKRRSKMPKVRKS